MDSWSKMRKEVIRSCCAVAFILVALMPLTGAWVSWGGSGWCGTWAQF